MAESTSEPKTRANDGDVDEFLGSIENDQRREDAQAVCDLMQQITGEPPVMWGAAIVGFGSQRLTYATGRELDWPIVAMSPRKANTTIYINEGFEAHQDLMGRLGKHTTGKGCLYIKNLGDIDVDVLRELIESTLPPK